MSTKHPPRKTALNDWHRAHGGRMVDFSGWELPVHYAEGIITEHLQVRLASGVFDVSHMGRFSIEGADAESFLDYALTNAAHTLTPGTAHYTLLATPHGGAIDDAYLYRRSASDFLLVVNAGNREAAWAALEERRARFQVTLSDISDQLAMIALQGPDSERVLGGVIEAGAFPGNQRNCMSEATLDGESVLVARTGYTGERCCFELFTHVEHISALWDRLVDRGAHPIGLGARDSLRLEASLPLYGHELGADETGAEIPVLASRTSLFGIRKPNQGRYVGEGPISNQRRELEQLRAGNAVRVPQHLRRLVQPITVPDGRRPLRPGHRVRFGGREVGYVTSGTSVPFSIDANGSPLRAGKPIMRPIGLALVEAQIQFSDHSPVMFEIADERGRSQGAALVKGNLNVHAPT